MYMINILVAKCLYRSFSFPKADRGMWNQIMNFRHLLPPPTLYYERFQHTEKLYREHTHTQQLDSIIANVLLYLLYKNPATHPFLSTFCFLFHCISKYVTAISTLHPYTSACMPWIGRPLFLWLLIWDIKFPSGSIYRFPFPSAVDMCVFHHSPPNTR